MREILEILGAWEILGKPQQFALKHLEFLWVPLDRALPELEMLYFVTEAEDKQALIWCELFSWVNTRDQVVTCVLGPVCVFFFVLYPA